MHTCRKISDGQNTFTGFMPTTPCGNMTTGYPLKFLWHEATFKRSIATPSRCFPPLLPPSFLACPSPFPRTPKFPFPSQWLPSRQHESKKTECDSTKGNVTSGCIPTLKFLSHEVASGRSITTPSRIQPDETLSRSNLSKVTVPVTACLSTQSLKEKKGSGRNLQQASENNTNCK